MPSMERGVLTLNVACRAAGSNAVGANGDNVLHPFTLKQLGAYIPAPNPLSWAVSRQHGGGQ